MTVLLVFAFLAGIFTVLSPCILPILPAILSAGTTHGKLRPLGIALGLILSFTLFTLTLAALTRSLGISPDALRYIAIALIAIFGLIMIFPKLSDLFSSLLMPVTSLGTRLRPTTQRAGLASGILFGAVLGILWTPCAGPILAAITTLVATQSVNFTAVLLTLAYSLGAAIPMFLIAYGGTKIIDSSRFLSSHAVGLRQIFGGLMLLTAVAMAIHWDLIIQQRISNYFPALVIEDNALVRQEIANLNGSRDVSRASSGTYEPGQLPYFGQAPEFVGIDNWINSSPLSTEKLKGKVVLVDFWTYSCINCLRTLPYLEKWYADYKDKGLVIVGVHTPEFEFEKNPTNVQEAAKRLGITYPIAQDNHYQTWQAYANSYWPAHYLIDQKGNIRMVHFGEGGYVATENDIRLLLNLPPINQSEPTASRRPITPETYLGAVRADNYAPDITLKPNETISYNYTPPLDDNLVGLRGLWRVEGERITSKSNASYIDLNFLAQNVYLVLTGTSTAPLVITLDDKPAGKIHVDSDRKYDIVKTTYDRHRLTIQVPEGISAYAFTFGDE